MIYPTVDVDAGVFDVYADLDTASEYLDSSIHAESWTAATDEEKGKALITARRTIDRQSFLGEKTDTAQALAFPRKETGIEGVVDTELPLDIVNANIELALSLLDGSDVQNQQTNVERVRSMSAGSVSISNFRGIDYATRFPQIVQELLGKYLGGADSSGTLEPKVTGVDEETIFPVELGFSPGGL